MDRRVGFALLAVLALSACGGGGGGGGGGSLRIALSPSPLTGSPYPSELPASYNVTAVASGSMSASTVYVAITDAAGTFTPGPVPVGPAAGVNTYNVTLTTAGTLSVGDHAGTLQARLCSDPNCNSVITTSALPYRITVRAPEVGMINPGALETALIQGRSTRLTISTIGVPVSSTLYARATDSNDVFDVSQPLALSMLQPQTYTLDVPARPDGPDTARTGTLGLRICADPGCATVYGTRSVPYSLQVLSIVAGSPDGYGQTDGPGTTATFRGPANLGVDDSGTVYVVDLDNQIVRRISSSYEVSSLPRIVGAAVAVTANGAGTAWISDGATTGSNRIEKRALDGSISPFATTPATFYGPAEGLAADAAGNVYAGTLDSTISPNRGRVYRFATDGTPSEIASGPPLVAPRYITIDRRDNTLYVSDAAALDIIRISPTGVVTALNAGINQPGELAVDSIGNLYVVDLQPRRLLRRTPAGLLTTVIPGDVRVTGNTMLVPSSVAITPDGRMFISAYANNIILRTILSP